MYEAHFQLRQAPFSIAPDPEFLYLSAGHREALAHLTYGLSHGGFVMLTGEVGTGKTTLLRNLLREMPPDVDTAFILNPRLTARELLETICDELGIDYSQDERASIKQLIDALNTHLLATHARGRSTVVIIDEAQNLAPAVLEQIRLLTNLETDKRKLLRIILLGQPELLDLLRRKELRQLAQRITARYHLRGLTRDDTYAYVAHRLQRAGGQPGIFRRAALGRLHRTTGGIPRVINLIADRAMLGTYAKGRHQVTWSMIGQAASEVLGQPRLTRRRLGAGGAAALAIGALVAFLLMPRDPAPHDHAPVRAADADVAAAAAPPPAPDRAALADVPDAAADEVEAAQPVAEPLPAIAPEAQRADPTDTVTVSGTRPIEQILTELTLSTARTQQIAYHQAFAAWAADFGTASPATIPCDFAPQVGLQCLGGSGTWSDLRRFNLPAVLELWDADSKLYYAALTRMAGERITLNIAGTDFDFERAALSRHWFGAYVLLWKMPPNYIGTLREDDEHPAVEWLRRQLGTLDLPAPADTEPNRFDAGLRDAVVAFQEREGLLTDGLVGPQTWIRLSQRLDIPQPRLEE
jgi:general secretion pathway protein A